MDNNLQSLYFTFKPNSPVDQDYQITCKQQNFVGFCHLFLHNNLVFNGIMPLYLFLLTYHVIHIYQKVSNEKNELDDCKQWGTMTRSPYVFRYYLPQTALMK